MVYNPVKELDKVILRQYTKIAKRWEDKGHSIYSLSSMLGIPSCLPGLAIGEAFLGIDLNFFYNLGIYIPYALDLNYNLAGLHGYLSDKVSGNDLAIDRLEFISEHINKILRLPTFLAGIGLTGKMGYDIFSSQQPFDSIITYLPMSLALLGLSSSMYLKDTDPKLLQKQPSKLKAKLQKLGSRIKDFVPKPLPSPKPAFESTLTSELFLV